MQHYFYLVILWNHFYYNFRQRTIFGMVFTADVAISVKSP